MTRTPGRPGVARASRIRFSSAGAIGGRPRRFPSLLARASPARTRSAIIARYKRTVGLAGRSVKLGDRAIVQDGSAHTRNDGNDSGHDLPLGRAEDEEGLIRPFVVESERKS
jgi:hypothetical protein